MKIVAEGANVESEGTSNELTFGADNLGFVFEILRSKLYSNPIKAICREITCNARDAHREAGKGDVPIEIDFPTPLASELRIRDFGHGISPERMKNVFLQYGASTKRGSNEQTGGFGIGAKTPFAYSDSFSIITTVAGKTRTYTAYIDESQVGKIALMSTKKTNKPSGTEIVIAIKPVDYDTFKKEILTATFWWNPRPIITSGNGNAYGMPEESMISLKSTIPGIDIYVDSHGHHGYYLDGPSKHTIDSFDRNAFIILIDRMPYSFDDKKTLGELHNAYRDELMHTVYRKRCDGFSQNNHSYYPGGDRYRYISDRSMMFGRPPIFMMYPPKYVFNFDNGELNVAINRETFSMTQDVLACLRNKIVKATEHYMYSINSKELSELMYYNNRYY